MHDEEFTDPPPPSADRVARRALILSVVSCRGFAEGDRFNPTGPEEVAEQSREWLAELGLERELSEWERELLNAPFGSPSERDQINASWLSEAVTVMAWALGRIELPGFDQQCDPGGIANALGFLADRDETVLAAPELRPSDQTGSSVTLLKISTKSPPTPKFNPR